MQLHSRAAEEISDTQWKYLTTMDRQINVTRKFWTIRKMKIIQDAITSIKELIKNRFHAVCLRAEEVVWSKANYRRHPIRVGKEIKSQ